MEMNNSVDSDKANKESNKYLSKAKTKKIVKWGLISIGIATVYFILHYINQYVGNLVLK